MLFPRHGLRKRQIGGLPRQPAGAAVRPRTRPRHPPLWAEHRGLSGAAAVVGSGWADAEGTGRAAGYRTADAGEYAGADGARRTDPAPEGRPGWPRAEDLADRPRAGAAVGGRRGGVRRECPGDGRLHRGGAHPVRGSAAPRDRQPCRRSEQPQVRENRHCVSCCQSSPGARSIGGKPGWFGASGQNCASIARPS